MPGKKWPKSTKISVRISDVLLEKKPKDKTISEWIKELMEKYNAD